MRAKKIIHLVLVLFFALAMAGGLAGAIHSREPHVLVVQINGVIDPAVERFVARAVKTAEDQGAEALVIQLDTPGGLLSSTRTITQHLLEADVPSIVYVAPRGARAASAGTFIIASANFAVMAPGSHLGAASPVRSNGTELSDTVKSKVFNDAAAEMRSIARLRGRNQEQLEATVLDAVAFTAEEAVQANVVDFIASDLAGVLEQVNGRETALLPPDGSSHVMNTEGLPIVVMEMSLVERFLHVLSDPTISFLLFSLGSLGLWIELVNPGLIFPGVTGVILLVLALLSMGNLPVNWFGVALILLALILAVLELYVSGFGVLGVGALVSLILGGMFFFVDTELPSPTMAPTSVSFWVLGITATLLAGVVALTGWAVAQSRKDHNEGRDVDLVGEVGEVMSDLAPRGTVRLRNELWTALIVGEARSGERVKVVEINGITLKVVKLGQTDVNLSS